MRDAGKLCARVFRYLLFLEEYSILENNRLLSNFLSDGLFPFIEMIGSDFTRLETAYLYKDDPVRFRAHLSEVFKRFDEARMEKLQDRWWRYEPFSKKKTQIKEAISACLKQQYVASIKILYSEIEGIIRLQYHQEKGQKPTFKELLDFVRDKAILRYNDPSSLGFPVDFFNYLSNQIFAGFNVETGDVDLSRHNVGHGVAEAELYTQEKALQAILVLDQIRFYLR